MTLPTLPAHLPKRGNRLTKIIGQLWFAITGWRIVGPIPNVSKVIGVAAPHESAWDVILAVAFILGMDLRAHWMGKHTIFKKPFAWFPRWLGGIRVDRRSPQGVVKDIVREFQIRDQFALGLAPEGSRKRAGIPVKNWKSGYYYIAYEAEVPLVPIYLDRPSKRLIFGPIMMLTGNKDADVSKIQDFYDNQTTN